MKNLNRRNTAFLAAILLWSRIESAAAVEFEPLGKAVATLLGTTQAFKKGDFFYAKGSDGKAARVVAIEKGIYPPNCTHTWAIALNPASGAVSDIRVIEMSCPHAFPTRAASYLGQYKGIGPKTLSTLDDSVTTIAKATGSCKLATDAVRRSVTAYSRIKGQL